MENIYIIINYIINKIIDYINNENPNHIEKKYMNDEIVPKKAITYNHLWAKLIKIQIAIPIFLAINQIFSNNNNIFIIFIKKLLQRWQQQLSNSS